VDQPSDVILMCGLMSRRDRFNLTDEDVDGEHESVSNTLTPAFTHTFPCSWYTQHWSAWCG